MTNLDRVSDSDIPDVPDGARRRAGGLLKVAVGVGTSLTPAGRAAKVVFAGAGSLIAGAGAVDMAVGDEPGIPSYTGGGDMVTRGTDYEMAGQAFDFGVGVLAPTNRLPKSFDTMGEVLDGASNAGTLIDGYGLYHSLSEEAEGGIQAPNATTRQLEPNNPQQDEKSIHELGGPYRQN